LDLVIPRLCLTSNPSALELGTAVGPGALYLARHGFATTGWEVISEAIYQARRIAEAEGLSVTFEKVDATQIPHAGDAFDLIVDTYCSTHVVFDHERSRIVYSVRARLKPDEYFLITSSVYESSRRLPYKKVVDDRNGTV